MTQVELSRFHNYPATLPHMAAGDGHDYMPHALFACQTDRLSKSNVILPGSTSWPEFQHHQRSQSLHSHVPFTTNQSSYHDLSFAPLHARSTSLCSSANFGGNSMLSMGNHPFAPRLQPLPISLKSGNYDSRRQSSGLFATSSTPTARMLAASQHHSLPLAPPPLLQRQHTLPALLPESPPRYGFFASSSSASNECTLPPVRQLMDVAFADDVDVGRRTTEPHRRGSSLEQLAAQHHVTPRRHAELLPPFTFPAVRHSLPGSFYPVQAAQLPPPCLLHSSTGTSTNTSTGASYEHQHSLSASPPTYQFCSRKRTLMQSSSSDSDDVTPYRPPPLLHSSSSLSTASHASHVSTASTASTAFSALSTDSASSASSPPSSRSPSNSISGSIIAKAGPADDITSGVDAAVDTAAAVATAPGVHRCPHAGCRAAPFQTQYLLNSHTTVHSSSRPHYCPVPTCPRARGGKGFKRKNEMLRHGLVHDSPGYVCPFCPPLEQHAGGGGRAAGAGTGTASVPTARHAYPRPDNLQRHVRMHHNDVPRDDPRLRDVLAQRPARAGAAATTAAAAVRAGLHAVTSRSRRRRDS